MKKYLEWTNNTIEESAQEQINAVVALPFMFHHAAFMPDCHAGYGMPIGGVFASKDVIVPNMVGVDIGCGVAFAKTDILANTLTRDAIKEILGIWRKDIPVGFEVHKEQKYAIPEHILPDLTERDKCSIGTLGGGNHFLELTKSEDGFVCILLHTGSRNFGARVCKVANEVAITLNKMWYSPVPEDLAFLPISSQAGKDYLEKMGIALEYAHLNRAYILAAALKTLPMHSILNSLNCHHNYAALEHHHGENVWVHRKGAIRARKGEQGIIPGSMGTASYIVEGLGNPASYFSASHGAGRKMSRMEANNTITEEEANKAIEGIVFGRWSRDRRTKKLDVSESPGAYKDIDTVMKNQVDLVKIVEKLSPLGCIKGA